MKLTNIQYKARPVRFFTVAFVLFAMMLAGIRLDINAQVVSGFPESRDLNKSEENSGFRVEKTPVAGGSELITIFAKRTFHDGPMPGPVSEIPLVSVLRDTLGDGKTENDRLRYVWMLTYTKPTFAQKASAFIPFLYTRTTNKNNIGTEPPPPVIDLNRSGKAMWNQVFWTIFKRLIFDDIGVGLKASTLQYRQNKTDYRRSGIATAAAVLSLYQEMEGEKVLTDTELKDIQARLFLTEKPLGWHMQSENLGRVYDKETGMMRDYRGHNWELLRQYSEAQGLYFEPLEMPDGSARHAIVWVSASDLQANKGRKFDRRFLNIKNPWDDGKLANWKGYSEVRWYDDEDRQVEPDTPNAHPKTMIPLALYGLDHPKVPVILVDFRDNGNPKFREMSRRVLNDLTGNVLSLSAFGGLPFFVGRFVYDFATGRRGADLNQASRLRSYAQLKLLVSLDDSLDNGFKAEISDRVESATLNPLQNDAEVEARLAHAQYKNLMAYAADPEGLPKTIANDRREEMTKLKHNGKTRALFALGHLFSFGLYTHRETSSPELMAELDTRRQLDYHERFLREVAFTSADPEIDSRPDAIKVSLSFVSHNGSAAQEKTTRALAKIFSISRDDDIQTLCLMGLYRINSSAAKKELLAIYKNSRVEDRWRNTSAEYLRLALKEGQRMSVSDARLIANIASN
ncbi:MAG: hypothetical protein ABL999_08810 [Pyrinomonadaceae bacterium]